MPAARLRLTDDLLLLLDGTSVQPLIGPPLGGTPYSIIYPSILDAILTGSIDFGSIVLAARGASAAMTFDGTNTVFADLAPAGALLGTNVALSSVAINSNQVDADPVNIPAITTGEALRAVIIFEDTGVPSTSRLVCWLGRYNDTTTLRAGLSAGAPIVFPSTGIFSI